MPPDLGAMTPPVGAQTPLTAWLRAVLWGAVLVPATAFVGIAAWGFERARREAELAVAHACDLAHGQARRTFAVASEIASRADAASSGDDLASAAEQPDAVLSDIAMPGSMNGIGLAFALRKERPRLPVVLTTGYTEQIGEAAAAGFRVRPKPTAPKDLLEELRVTLAAKA